LSCPFSKQASSLSIPTLLLLVVPLFQASLLTFHPHAPLLSSADPEGTFVMGDLAELLLAMAGAGDAQET
jgi:hypothetical protein